MKTINNSMRLLALAAVMLVGLSAVVGAVGVGMPYWKENPLNLSPGESKEVAVNLQNMVGTEGVTLEVALLSGSEVAKLTDASTQYALPAGTETSAHLLVAVPKDAAIGSEYTVTIEAKTLGAGQGAISLGSAYQVSFPVVVVQAENTEQAAPALNSMWVLLGAVVVIAVLWIIIAYLRKRK